MKNSRDIAGTYRGKTVYNYDTISSYLNDVHSNFEEDYYGLIDKTKLCYGVDQIGEVIWDKDGANDVSLYIKPKSLLKRGMRAKTVKIEEVNLFEEDIDLISIEDIIEDIRNLKIDFDSSPIC